MKCDDAAWACEREYQPETTMQFSGTESWWVVVVVVMVVPNRRSGGQAGRQEGGHAIRVPTYINATRALSIQNNT